MALTGRIEYKRNLTNQPIVVLTSGFNGDLTDWTEATFKRFANYGLFMIWINVRGKGTSGGDQDCCGRSVQDIIDAVEYAKANYGTFIDPTNVNVLGYSEAGAYALACAMKYPDYFNTITSFFGISDYGYDGTDGWYQNAAKYQAGIATRIGGTPAGVPNNYYSRYARGGITNYKGGHLFLFADEDDAVVNIENTQNVGAAMAAAGLSNYTMNITTAADDPRWTHGYPNSTEVADLIDAEPLFIPQIVAKTYPSWTIATSGTVFVGGYIVTKRFTIWLGGLTEAAAGAGMTEAANVTYNTITGQYTITPLTGNMDVFIKQGNLTASASITAATTLTVA